MTAKLINVFAPYLIFLNWFLIGWVVLSLGGVKNLTIKGLLSPAVGLATVTLIISSASLMGIPIKNSMWLVVAISLIALMAVARSGFGEVKKIALFNVSLISFNLAIVGLGIIIFGNAWHGLTNGDAATNSLAAQYFLSNSFLSSPSMVGIASGKDYSPLSSMLYVSGGHRFGDVMLLGLSAGIFHVQPDQIYMAHSLAIRCAMLSSMGLLAYKPGTSIKWLFFICCLVALAPLGVYAYLAELISQTGGVCLIVTIGILFKYLVDNPGKTARLSFLIAIPLASLCQSYPESISLLLLASLIYIIHQLFFVGLRSCNEILKAVFLICTLVFLLINFYLPNFIAHTISSMGAVSSLATKVESASAAQHIAANSGNFNYAFTPDFLPILFGLQNLRSLILEPWAFLLLLTSFFSFFILCVLLIRKFNEYTILTAFILAMVCAFCFMYLRRNEFGTFKIMLLIQPFIFTIFAIAWVDAIRARRLLCIILYSALFGLAAKNSFAYLGASLNPYGPIPKMASNKVFDGLQNLYEKSARKTFLIESPTFLFGKFALLRVKNANVFFEQNMLAAFASDDLYYQLNSRPISKWLPDQSIFAKSLLNSSKASYEDRIFKCPSGAFVASFSRRIGNELNSILVVPGGNMVPLNRVDTENKDMLILNDQDQKQFLLFRPSSVGVYHSLGDKVAMYDMEADNFSNSGMNAVGRHIMLEVLGDQPNDVSLQLKFTRTYFGGFYSKLPRIILYGANSVELDIVGAGAASIVSKPIKPCVVDGKKYLIVDFGVDPSEFVMPIPWAYQFLNIPFKPDVRKSVGFLRDISLVKNDGSIDMATKSLDVKNLWNFNDFDRAYNFSGLFEDGWVSSNAFIRPKGVSNGKKLILKFEVPAEIAPSKSLLSVIVDGSLIDQKILVGGNMDLEIPLKLGRPSIRLEVNKGLVLPNGDGREVIGRLKAIEVE